MPKPPWFGSQPVQQITVLGLGTGVAPRDALFIDYSVSTILFTILSACLLLGKSRRTQELANARSETP
ncbi:hypothetical protein [Schlesneria paludicola]|uniref:hypothetical protein n=1 Tax=Schlesneria paludicola TaxID=360056 RepID=UPI0004929C31|nr:hypothetical protein [Schlesneria paludicola]